MNESPLPDAELLRHYTHDGSEQAFRELVQRHIQMVNCTARRIVGGDAHLAQDVIQMVFTDLARKARSLPNGVILGGWLHRHTCYTAANIVRTESRRRAREQQAADMDTLNHTPSNHDLWLQLTPVLDEALDRLAARDRDAIVLRYLEQQDLRTIGLALGTSQNTAHKRITRALEKLRIFLERRGITLSAALLATTLDAGAATTPPLPALVSTVSSHAITGAAAKTGFTLTTLHNMITSKIAIGTATVIVLAGLTITLVAQNHSSSQPPAVAVKPIKLAPAPAPSQLPVLVTLTSPPQSQSESVRAQIQAQATAIMASGQDAFSNTDGSLTFGATGAPAAPAGFAPPAAPPPPGPGGFGGARFGGGMGGFGGPPNANSTPRRGRNNGDGSLTIDGVNGNSDMTIATRSNSDGTETMTVTENGVSTTTTGSLREIINQYTKLLLRDSNLNAIELQRTTTAMENSLFQQATLANERSLLASSNNGNSTNPASANGNAPITPPPAP